MIEHVHTGERVEFVDETPGLLTMHVTWPPRRHRAWEHVHPSMEERFEVLDGAATIVVDGVTVEAAAGTRVVVPPGRRHLAWNPAATPSHLRIEMRPALRWREFTTRLFAGEDPRLLLAEFAPEVNLPPR